MHGSEGYALGTRAPPAARKGLAIRKASRGQEHGRYFVVDPDFGGPIRAHSRTYPYSFSLEEAEKYIAEYNRPILA